MDNEIKLVTAQKNGRKLQNKGINYFLKGKL